MTVLNAPKTETSDAPLVSVIIPFFNAAKYLRESIESVLRQSYVNWELLLIDDGSTDNGNEIAKQFEEPLRGKVIVLEHPGHVNRGISASRNLAISNSNGPVVAFLDADDVFYPDALSNQVDALIANPEAGAIIPQLLYWRSWESGTLRETSDFIPDFQIPLNSVVQPPTLLLRLYPLGSAPAPAPTGIFVRRETLEKIGGFEESFHGADGLYEDQGLLSKLYLATPIFVSGNCIAKYRLHPDSLSAIIIAGGHYHSVRLGYLQWFTEYLRQHDISNPEIDALLDRAMWPYRHPALHAMLSLPKQALQSAKSLAKKAFLR